LAPEDSTQQWGASQSVIATGLGDSNVPPQDLALGREANFVLKGLQIHRCLEGTCSETPCLTQAATLGNGTFVNSFFRVGLFWKGAFE
jgi:hypothetical protein